MTAPQDRDSAALLRRVERLEAEVRRITGILAAVAGGGTPGGSNAEAWIAHMARQSEDAYQLRRALGEEPPLRRSPVSTTAASHPARTGEQP